MLFQRRPSFKIYRKPRLSLQIEKSFRTLYFSVAIMLTLLYSIYLIIGNNLIAKGYTLKKIQDENSILYQESHLLDSKIVSAKTFYNLEKNTQTKGMITVENVIFVKKDQFTASAKSHY